MDFGIAGNLRHELAKCRGGCGGASFGQGVITHQMPEWSLHRDSLRGADHETAFHLTARRDESAKQTVRHPLGRLADRDDPRRAGAGSDGEGSHHRLGVYRAHRVIEAGAEQVGWGGAGVGHGDS